MKIMVTSLMVCGTFLLISASYARPGHHFKELILREPIVPFDDSMVDDDIYGDYNDNKVIRPNSDLSSTSKLTTMHAGSHSELTGSPQTGSENVPSETVGILLSTDSGEGNSVGGNGLDDAVEEERPFGEAKTVTEFRGQTPGQGVRSVVTTVAGDVEKISPTGSEDREDATKFNDSCRYVYCRVGRVCIMSPNGRGKCVCAGPGHCKTTGRKVCGSDGQVYPSHCELHRSACLRGVHIGTDRSGEKCNGHLANGAIEVFNPTTEVHLGEASDGISTPYATPQSSNTRCAISDLKALISNLIDIHCSKPGTNLSCTNAHDRSYAVRNMFSHYDHNSDKFLDDVELSLAENQEHSSGIPVRCSLADLLRSAASKVTPGKMSSSEFLAAFGVSSSSSLDKTLHFFTTSVTVGNSVELKCDVKGIDRIVWKRNGNSLDGTVDKQIRVFHDGSLYIGDLRLEHTGSYTCQDRMNDAVIQTHVLLVQTLPQVRVHPSTQIHLSGSTVSLKCFAEGVPRPEIMWEKNEWPIQPEDENYQRYLFLRNRTCLEIKSADYKHDTGAYKCKAKNSAGTSDQVAAVFIENVASSRHSYLKHGELFAVFHDTGYIVYEVSQCHTEHQVTGDYRGFKISPEVQKEKEEAIETLCPENETCSWSDAVLVKGRFMYAAQPKQRRVVVVELGRSNPIEMILVKCVPDKLNYVEHLDEVWVTCRRHQQVNQSEPSLDIVIIRQASTDRQHFPSALPRISTGTDQITGVFLPGASSLQHNFEYGYIGYGSTMMLRKLHLASAACVRDISLQDHHCNPTSLHFIPIGGLVLIGCSAKGSEEKPKFHLLFDYVTDGLLQRLEVNGDSYLSPDARSVVIVGDGGKTAFVFKVSDEGVLQHVFDEYTQLQLEDIFFFPSESGFDYQAVVTTAGQPTILILDLETGRVSSMEGMEGSSGDGGSLTRPGRSIQGGGPFAERLLTASSDSVFVVDAKRRRLVCRWSDVSNARLIVALPEQRHD